MKRTLIWSLGIFIALVCAGWATLHYLEKGYIAERVSAAAAKATGSPIVFAGVPSISVFPPSLKFGHISWKSAGYNPVLSFSADGGLVELDTAKLFSGKMEIREISLDKPVLEISEAESAAGKARSGPKNALAHPALDLGRLVARGGEIIYSDPEANVTLKNINFSGENLRKRQEMDIKCDFVVNVENNPQSSTEEHLFAGNMAFRGKIRYYEPNLTFRHSSVTFTATDSRLVRTLSPMRLALEGGINLSNGHLLLQNANFAAPQGTIELKGEGNISERAFTGDGHLETSLAKLAAYLDLREDSVASPEMDAFILAGSVNLRDGLLALDDLAIKLGNGSGTGKLSVKFPEGDSPAAIEGHLDIGKVAINTFSFASAPGSAPKPKARVQAAKPAYPFLNCRVDISGLNIKKVNISNLGFLLHGERGVYRFDDFTFSVAQGGVLAFAEANLSTNEMSLRANGQDVNLGIALNEMGFDGLESGRTTFEADIHATGEDLDAIKRSLSGKGQLESRGLKIAALNSITNILQLFGGKNVDFGDSLTFFSALFSAQNGHVRFSPITATSRGISLEGGALVNLSDSYLDGTANIKAMGLELPVTFAGPFSDIKFGVNPDIILNANKKLPETLLRSMEEKIFPSLEKGKK